VPTTRVSLLFIRWMAIPVVGVERDDAAWEVVGDPTEQLVSIVGPQVHGQSFGNDQRRKVGRNPLQPLRCDHQGADHPVVVPLREDLGAHADDLGVVDVVPRHARSGVDSRRGNPTPRLGAPRWPVRAPPGIPRSIRRSASRGPQHWGRSSLISSAAWSRSRSSRRLARPSCHRERSDSTGRRWPFHTGGSAMFPSRRTVEPAPCCTPSALALTGSESVRSVIHCW